MDENKFTRQCEEFFPLVVQATKDKGRGVFTTVEIPCGQIIVKERTTVWVESNESPFSIPGLPKYEPIPFLNEAENLQWENWLLIDLLVSNPELKAQAKELACADKKYNGKLPRVNEVVKFIQNRHQKIKNYVTKEDILWANQVIVANAFSMNMYFVVQGLGTGLYFRASLLNHSCLPNANFYFNLKGEIVVYSARDIAAGEELFISYLSRKVMLSPFALRKDAASQVLCFECQCELCRHETDRLSFTFLTPDKARSEKDRKLAETLWKLYQVKTLTEEFLNASFLFQKYMTESLLEHRGSLFTFLSESLGYYALYKIDPPPLVLEQLPRLLEDETVDLVDRLFISMFLSYQEGKIIVPKLPVNSTIIQEMFEIEFKGIVETLNRNSTLQKQQTTTKMEEKKKREPTTE